MPTAQTSAGPLPQTLDNVVRLSTPISAGQIATTATVTVRYRIAP